MLSVTPARRATVDHILQHWWVNLGYDVTPDGKPYEPLTAPTPGGPSHRKQSSFSSDSDVELESRSPPPGLHHRPGSRVGRKSAETSFDEDELLYDIGTSVSTSAPAPAVRASPVSGQPSCSKPAAGAEEKTTTANLHWRQAIANSIVEIETRVIQSLGADELQVLQSRGPEGEVEEGKTSFVFSFDNKTDSCSDSDKADACDNSDKSSVFTSDQTGTSDAEKQAVLMFDSDRKPRRGILKRKGKFSGGDSGCCIMADDASPKLEEEEPLSPKPAPPPASDCYNSSSSSSGSATLTFSKDLSANAASNSANANTSQSITSWSSSSSQGERSTSPNSTTSVPVNQCPVHRYPTSNTLPCASQAQSHVSNTPPPSTTTLPCLPSALRQPQSPEAPTEGPEGKISQPATVENLNQNHTQNNPASLPPLPYSSGALTNAVCTCTLDMDVSKVVRRRKGILKNGGGGGGSARNSLIEDARKRLSMGSLSSNSSADILDLSYDSGDGEQMMMNMMSPSLPQYPAMSPRNRGSLALMEAGDRSSFSLDGEFTALSLEGIAASDPRQPLRYNVGLDSGEGQCSLDYSDNGLFDYAEARAVCQQALSLINTQ
nr:hypothetical protein BaRGS_020058 [Batillaria attramentaria]